MAMVLALFAASMVVTVITAIVLAEALRTADSSARVRENPHPKEAPRFFAKDIPAPVHTGRASRVPVEVLLIEIERHVRLEREAAESFHLSPTPQTLHVQAAPLLLH
jgi:hypothetical protein